MGTTAGPASGWQDASDKLAATMAPRSQVGRGPAEVAGVRRELGLSRRELLALAAVTLVGCRRRAGKRAGGADAGAAATASAAAEAGAGGDARAGGGPDAAPLGPRAGRVLDLG